MSQMRRYQRPFLSVLHTLHFPFSFHSVFIWGMSIKETLQSGSSLVVPSNQVPWCNFKVLHLHFCPQSHSGRWFESQATKKVTELNLKSKQCGLHKRMPNGIMMILKSRFSCNSLRSKKWILVHTSSIARSQHKVSGPHVVGLHSWCVWFRLSNTMMVWDGHLYWL